MSMFSSSIVLHICSRLHYNFTLYQTNLGKCKKLEINYIYIYMCVCVCAYYGVVNNSINDMFIPDIFTFSLNSIGYLSIILLL